MPHPTSQRPAFWAPCFQMLADGLRLVRAGGVRLVALILLTQFVIAGAGFPVLRWLFAEALRAGGMHALDLGSLRLGPGLPLTLALIVAIVALAFWLISLQFTALVVLLRWAPEGVSSRELLRELGRVARKLLRPSSLPLLAYLFLLLPLTGFGFTSALAKGVAIPPFISGELMKSLTSGAALVLLLVVLAFVNMRLALTVPLFVLTNATGGRAQRVSWRLTRSLRTGLQLLIAVSALFIAAGALTVAVLVPALVPTALADALAPAASPVVAAFSLGAAQVCGILLSGFATSMLAAILIVCLGQRVSLMPAGVSELRPAGLGEASATGDAGAADGPARSAAGADRDPRRGRALGWAVAGAAVLTAAALGAANLPVMRGISQAPDTLVLAHRGFSDGGVENTIGGLEAAAAAGADLVEMDVMQTKDGGFVAMHDASLARLAGREEMVKDLTLAELTRITVHDAQGHEGTIPSFADYVSRARELGMPLLIEIKLGGADTPDHVDRLVDELEGLGALEDNIYHSLDAPSVERLKQLRPDLTVGYTMAFAAVDAPDTPADFVVIEQWTATEEMQRAAWNAGLGFMAWTVNDENGIREHLRRDTDGIITDHPDIALAARAGMEDESGLADALVDMLTRFVTVV